MWYLKRVAIVLLTAYLIVAGSIAGSVYLWGVPVMVCLKIGFSWSSWPWLLKWI